MEEAKAQNWAVEPQGKKKNWHHCRALLSYGAFDLDVLKL
jgi:hypothetical protein